MVNPKHTPTTTTDPWGQLVPQPPKMGLKNCPWNFWKPHPSDYVAAGVFLFPETWRPYFWKPYTSDYVAAGAFSFQKNDPHIFGICRVNCGGGGGFGVNQEKLFLLCGSFLRGIAMGWSWKSEFVS